MEVAVEESRLALTEEGRKKEDDALVVPWHDRRGLAP